MTRMTAFALQTKQIENQSLHSGPHQNGGPSTLRQRRGWILIGSSWTSCVHWVCKSRRKSHPPIATWSNWPSDF